MAFVSGLTSRKQKRKEERSQRKRRRKTPNDESSTLSKIETSSPPRIEAERKRVYTEKPLVKKKKKAASLRKSQGGLVDEAIRRDDEEIANLEEKLGIRKGKKSKEQLHKEFAIDDGFGEDFVDFLGDLDQVVKRLTNDDSNQSPPESDDDHSVNSNADLSSGSEDEIVRSKAARGLNDDQERGDDASNLDEPGKGITAPSLDPLAAEAIRKEDGNIAELESRLGLKGKKKKNLNRLFAEEGFGDDFGDFLGELDDVCERVTTEAPSTGLSRMNHQDSRSGDMSSSESGSEEEEESSASVHDSGFHGSRDSEMGQDRQSLSASEDEDTLGAEDREGAEEDDSDLEGDEHPDDNRKESIEPDHDTSLTYHPAVGEDIYGNKLHTERDSGAKPSRYVPPHLRKDQQVKTVDNEQQLREIRRSLNNALNRLSEDTLISVAQSLAQLYRAYPTSVVHEAVWSNMKNACVSRPILMTGLIPVYVACMVGVHIQSVDTVQLGEHILESTVTELCRELDSSSSSSDAVDENQLDDGTSKSSCNLMLILCYLYNYNIVHCSFMYDIIRRLISSFSELDIECLLILLSHAGKSLRSDDPSALKEIVLLVQKRTSSDGKQRASSSRIDYMVSAIMDLKNNRRSKQDSSHYEKASKIRKLLGRIKSNAASAGRAKASSESSLRISLEDILNSETKGRWWRVGASWVGNQYRLVDGASHQPSAKSGGDLEKQPNEEDEHNEKLLQLATKLRINTDRKRAVFCIIMGGTDCDDVFEKLCRGSMLQNRSERDTVRVLIECCGQEKSYNKFYGHLAARLCEYQPQCKFSFQLAFWDVYKQFDSMSARRSANLAKLLFNLVSVHNCLKLHAAVKTIDMSDDELPEATMIFLTVFFSSIFSHFDDPMGVKSMFTTPKEADLEQTVDGDGLESSILYFLLETLKSSPSNKKGTKFRENFKAAVKALDRDGLEDML